MAASFGAKRSFLFLQGLSTPFFFRLGREIKRCGHSVHRINFSGGDRLFWPGAGATDYRKRFSEWRGFLGDFLKQRTVTDIVLFGDCRPYHRVAIDVARARGIAVHVFEEGYFRPDWITLEKQGTNAFSGLPRDAAALLREASREGYADNPPQSVSGGFMRRARWEIMNQAATLTLSPVYHHYRRHRARHPLIELRGWFWRVVLKRSFEGGYTKRLTQHLRDTGCDYFLLPLQLDTDYQIRRHSGFRSMTDVMGLVMESFAREAPAASKLVIKVHPLDNGLTNFRKAAKRLAGKLNLAGRVFVIDGGHLPTLLAKSRGVVVVNSTTGLSALHHNCPLKVLGRALFDMPGLTFQGSLDRFWNDGASAGPGALPRLSPRRAPARADQRQLLHRGGAFSGCRGRAAPDGRRHRCQPCAAGNPGRAPPCGARCRQVDGRPAAIAAPWRAVVQLRIRSRSAPRAFPSRRTAFADGSTLGEGRTAEQMTRRRMDPAPTCMIARRGRRPPWESTPPS